ncbi:MAG: DNA-binding response regulator [Bacteroidetes bacterium]|nr:MAG: DNA-binding response regulator [Bacteroidota bacterium]TAG89657.1 MAG: DNA-binding response regulator [Bacteroidota bacterium]
MILKTIIVDDEPMARNVLRGMLEESFASNISIIQECKDVPEAVKAINTLQPDVVFLDIEMPTYSGFDLLDFFDTTKINFKIIFVTAYSEYSLQAFEISAIDYILKPVRFEALDRAVKKLISKPKIENESANYKTLLENMQNTQDKKIILQTAEDMHIVKLSEIIYIEADSGYCNFYTETQGVILISKRLTNFEYLEIQDGFFRSHRSYLINTKKIVKIDKKNFTILMNNKKEVPLAQDKKNILIDKLGQE